MFHTNDRLVLFIDGANLLQTAKRIGLSIDYKRLLNYFTERSTLIRANFYAATIGHLTTEDTLRPLYTWLGYNGYCMVTKPARAQTNDQGKRLIKGNMDGELIVDAMELAPRIDHAVLFSGDGDFCALVKSLKRQGVYVTVVSTNKAEPPILSLDLRDCADAFIDLDDIRDSICTIRDGTRALAAS